MRKFMPIMRDSIHGIFDRDVSGKIVLVNMDATQVSRMLIEVLEMFTKIEGKKGVVLSYDRPAWNIHEVLRKFWIPTKDLVFVDGVSRLSGHVHRPIGQGLVDPQVIDVLDPFDVRCLLGRIRASFLLQRSRRIVPSKTQQVALANRKGEDMARAELGLLGMDGVEWSIMRYRILERAKGNAKTHPKGDDDDWEGAYAADFMVIENLTTIMCYLSREGIEELIGGLRSFIAEGLCRTVIILLDREQYMWLKAGLRDRPDVMFELETNVYHGVIGYRLIPGDNGL
jgi:hypothetical protein